MNDTTTISVPAVKLRLMLTAVLAHTDDWNAPVICSVRFEFHAGTLYLVATDRYSLGVAREVIQGSLAAGISDQAAILPIEGARDLRRMLKRYNASVALTISADRITVEAPEFSGSWKTAEGVYPDWRRLLNKLVSGEPQSLGDAGVDPEKLGRLTAIANGGGDSLNIRFLVPPDAKPQIPAVVATAGDWFIGAVMPRHPDDDAGAQWQSWAAATAPEPATLKVPEPPAADA